MNKPMNKIEKLIAALCPEGVEWKTLGEIGEFVRGNGLPKSDFTGSGVGCIHYGQIYTYYGTFTDKTKSFVSPETAKKLQKVHKNDLIITNTSENIEDVCKTVVWLGNDEIVTGGHASIFKHNENPKYLAYYTQTLMFSAEKRKLAKGTKVIDVSAKDLAKIKIPIPPLAVQQEIVKILDTFTTLEAELEAELEARKKQYEYYRKELLMFGDDVKWKTLDEVCISINAGGDLPKNYLKGQNEPTPDFPFPIYSNGTEANALYGYTDDYRIDNEAVTISARGTIGYHAVRSPKFTPIVRLLVLIPKKNIATPQFLNYVLDITAIGHSGGSIPQLTVPNVKKIKIPIPPLAEQERIIVILDKFDALVNDISVGLPAELNARRKQYEYYRGKLLTFEPLENEYANQ